VSTTGTYAINTSATLDGAIIGGTFKAQTPTEIKLSSFTATERPGGQVLAEWRTGFETDTLGFRLYRETGGQRVQVMPSLLAGSALFAGENTTLTVGKGLRLAGHAPSRQSAIAILAGGNQPERETHLARPNLSLGRPQSE
jgi:hypothetical protein